MKECHIVWFYKTSVGLKNAWAGHLFGARDYTIIEDNYLPADIIMLGPDYLKDQYTLLGCPISDSPHFYLMRTINEKGNLAETDYMKRISKGTLDWRFATPIPKNFNSYYKEYHNSLEEIQRGDYRPVVVYYLNGKCYVYDGKHRAALCALLNIPVHCHIVSSEIANADLLHYMFGLINGKKDYKLHTEFHSEYMKGLKGYECR